MQKTPHMLIEGIVIASYAAGTSRSFIYIRGEYVLQADVLDAALARSARGGLRRREHPRLGALAVAGRAPRRRRLHLRRGDRPARLARRQARQPAPEAAVPGHPGPLPGADADQQRRDARRRCRRSSAWAARSTRSSASETSTGTKLVSVSGHVQRPGNYEIELGIPSREIIYGLAGGPPRGPRGQVLVPGRLLLAGADGRGPRRPLRLRLAGQGRLDARLGRDHRRRRLHADPRRGDEGREVLPPRVLRQVHAVPRGHQLDGQDARAHRRAARRRRWTSRSWPRCRSTSSATACACSATRWRCRSAR